LYSIVENFGLSAHLCKAKMRPARSQNVSSGGNSPKGKVDQLWDILKHREVHDIKDLSKELGYSNPQSFLNTKIIATMKDMDLAKKDSGKGKIQMKDKPFPSALA
jgi:hypothetical protein